MSPWCNCVHWWVDGNGSACQDQQQLVGSKWRRAHLPHWRRWTTPHLPFSCLCWPYFHTIILDQPKALSQEDQNYKPKMVGGGGGGGGMQTQDILHWLCIPIEWCIGAVNHIYRHCDFYAVNLQVDNQFDCFRDCTTSLTSLAMFSSDAHVHNIECFMWLACSKVLQYYHAFSEASPSQS